MRARDQAHGTSPGGEFGSHLDAGEPGADDGDPRIGCEGVHRGAQPLGGLVLGHRVREFCGAFDGFRHQGRAADGVDDIVVAHRVTGRQVDPAVCGVDAIDPVGEQPHTAAQQRPIVDDGLARTCRHLVQSHAMHELRTWVDERDVDVRVLLQAVGGQGAGITSADDDDAVGFVVSSHALESPPAPPV